MLRFGKKPKVLNPSNFGLVLLHITRFLIFLILSIYHRSMPTWDRISGFGRPLTPRGTVLTWADSPGAWLKNRK